MTQTTTLTIAISKALKAQATKVVTQQGMDLSTVIQLFLVKLVETGQLPFEPSESYSKIWNDDPEAIARFNREIGLKDDGTDFGREIRT